jgi:hypothetical protein
MYQIIHVQILVEKYWERDSGNAFEVAIGRTTKSS